LHRLQLRGRFGWLCWDLVLAGLRFFELYLLRVTVLKLVLVQDFLRQGHL
jgi:hypothetical protein